MPSATLSHRQPWPKALTSLPLFKQVVGFLWLALYLVTLLALISYDPNDVSFNVFPANPSPNNFIGYFGAGLACMLYYCFGFGAYLFPFLFLCCCGASFVGIEIRWRWKPVWIAFFIASACELLDLGSIGGPAFIERVANFNSPGGVLGTYINQLTVASGALGRVGAGALFTTILVISVIYLFNVNPVLTLLNAFSFYRDWSARREEERLAKAPPEEQLEVMRKRTQRKIEELQRKAREGTLPEPAEEAEEKPAPKVRIRRPAAELEDEEEPETLIKVPMKPAKVEPEPEPVAPPAKAIIRRPEKAEKIDKAAAIAPAQPQPIPNYVLPPLDLLTQAERGAGDVGLDEDALHRNLELIIDTLRRFGVKAEGREITPGATITRYEVYPGEGVRVDKITSLKRDLS
ncbi:MAG TPA: DNA translocase FtsK 4TM domain-containing protein, partial [Acidobacteriaceae bacterium]